MTFRLVRDAVEAEPVEPIEVKGKSEPVVAWRLLEVKPGVAGLVRRMDSPLVGRAAELARLGLELGRAKAERSCRTITIVGEPGVGKSRLAAELVSSLGDEALVLEGACLPYGSGITYWPLVEIVRRIDLDEALVAEPDADAIRGRIVEAVGRAEPRSRSDELYWAVRRLLEALARDRPVVLVLDDVQWAEPAFLDLVEYLAGWSRDAPVFICCLARSEFTEIRPGWPMLPLEPLLPDDAAVLLEHLAGPLESDATRALGRATGGNPLFLGEMVRMLAENDRLVERDGRVTAELDSLPVPETIQAVLAARLDRLADDERDVLQRASVIGQVFWWGPVAELTPPERLGAVASHLQALVRKGLLRPDLRTLVGEDGFRFAHILVRDAAYDSMPKRLRGELHERFADWVEIRAREQPELDEILGHHLEQARALRLELQPGGAEEDALALRAFEPLTRAGRRALGRGDLHATRSLLERAAALLPDGRRTSARADARARSRADGDRPVRPRGAGAVGGNRRTERRRRDRHARGADRARRAQAPQRSARRLGARSRPRGDARCRASRRRWTRTAARIAPSVAGGSSSVSCGAFGRASSPAARRRSSWPSPTHGPPATAGRRRRSSAGSVSPPGQALCPCPRRSSAATTCSSRSATTRSSRRAGGAGLPRSWRGRVASTRRVLSSARPSRPTRSSAGASIRPPHPPSATAT